MYSGWLIYWYALWFVRVHGAHGYHRFLSLGVQKTRFLSHPRFLHACKNSIFLTPACRKTYLHSLFEPSKGFAYLRPQGRTCLLLIVGKWQPGCFRKVERPIIVGDVVSLANVSDGTFFSHDPFFLTSHATNSFFGMTETVTSCLRKNSFFA